MSEEFEWRISTPAYSHHGLRFAWLENYRLRARQVGAEVIIEGNAAGLETLARHLLTLAQHDVPSGTHLHLEDSNGLEAGSIGVVLEREDDPAEYE